MKYYTPQVELEVIWDGRRDAHHGGYLAHIPEPTRAAPAREIGPHRRNGNIDAAIKRGHFAQELPSLDEIQRTEEP